MIKKVTIRFKLDQPEHREAYEILVARNRYRYSTYADYIVAALIAYAHQGDVANKVELTEKDKAEIVNEILQTLNKNGNVFQEPGI